MSSGVHPIQFSGSIPILTMSSISSAQVRELRGSVSRAAFAKRLGVTPNTVYRWELPEGAAEARRPRGAELEKLSRLQSGDATQLGPGPNQSPPKTLSAASDDLASALLGVERVLNGEAR